MALTRAQDENCTLDELSNVNPKTYGPKYHLK